MLNKVAKIVRGLSADGVEAANSGHPGLPLGCAEIGAVLFGKVMRYDPSCPDWFNRDRFVLSAGHGSMLLYSLLHLSGYDISVEDLKNFRQLNSKTPGHPEYREVPGVETTTGPLGQGFANAVGMALAESIMAGKYNTERKVFDHYTYTLLGDGCMMEGITSEAASFAGHLGLGKLIAIYDDNDISIEGSTDITFTESVADRYKAYHWHVIDGVDGHNVKELIAAIVEAKKVKDKPSLIIAKTHIGYGAPTKHDSSGVHGAPLGKEELKGLKENLGLPQEDFYVSGEVRAFFMQRREELQREREIWEAEFSLWAKENPELKKELVDAFELKLPADLDSMEIEMDKPMATRNSSCLILNKLAAKIPYLLGGSADLAPSNKTYLDGFGDIKKGSFKGKNIRFGVREHSMGAITNGLILHGGLRPYCSTFLVFADYMRPAIRMAALMKLPVVYVFTHDSIFVGEDGPTHQPIEHVESLRIIPNLQVIRPADTEETKLAWLEALKRKDGPTALILTRQALPLLEKERPEDFVRGGYLLSKGTSEDKVCLIASGSEVSLAVEVRELLQKEGVSSRVVSVPEREEFFRQDKDYLAEVLGPEDSLRVVLEAGRGTGWYRILNKNYQLVTIETFGASGPGEEVARHFGFEAQKIAKDIMKNL